MISLWSREHISKAVHIASKILLLPKQLTKARWQRLNRNRSVPKAQRIGRQQPSLEALRLTSKVVILPDGGGIRVCVKRSRNRYCQRSKDCGERHCGGFGRSRRPNRG